LISLFSHHVRSTTTTTTPTTEFGILFLFPFDRPTIVTEIKLSSFDATDQGILDFSNEPEFGSATTPNNVLLVAAASDTTRATTPGWTSYRLRAVGDSLFGVVSVSILEQHAAVVDNEPSAASL
jgi:hypothetical protein